MIINISTGASATEHDVRAAHPNTCFPSSLAGVDLTEFGYTHVQPATPPTFDEVTQALISGVQRVGDSWVQVWDVRSLTAEQVAANRQAAVSALESELDRYLDSVAQQYRFSDRTRLSLRAGYPNKWRDLAVAFGTWMDAVNALCEAAIAPMMLDKTALAARVVRAAGMLARADDERVLRLHPDDLKLVGKRLPEGLDVVPDPALERGALRVETANGGVEDGPAHWRAAIAEALGQC